MSVVKKNNKSKFTQVPNEIFTDHAISAKAVCVYGYIMSKPDYWVVNNTDIKKKLNIKTNDTIAKCFKELIKAGWLKRTKAVNNESKFTGGFDYQIFDTKQVESQSKQESSPDSEKFLIRENTKYGKTTKHSNTDFNSNTDLDTTRVVSVTSLKYPDEIREIFHEWNRLYQVKHKQNTKKYEYISVRLDRLLVGKPIESVKSGDPTKLLSNFIHDYNINEHALYRQYTADEIISVLKQIVNDQSSDSKLSLDEVLWNSFAGNKRRGFSLFYFVSDRNFIDKKYETLAGKLADTICPEISKTRLIDWAKTIQLFINDSDYSITDISMLLDWYNQYYSDKFTPKADDAVEFVSKYNKIKRAKERQEEANKDFDKGNDSGYSFLDKF